MTQTKNYLPSADSERADWLDNVEIKLPGYEATLGLSSADTQVFIADNAAFGYLNTLQNIIKQTLQNITSYKTVMKNSTANPQQ